MRIHPQACHWHWDMISNRTQDTLKVCSTFYRQVIMMTDPPRDTGPLGKQGSPLDAEAIEDLFLARNHVSGSMAEDPGVGSHGLLLWNVHRSMRHSRHSEQRAITLSIWKVPVFWVASLEYIPFCSKPRKETHISEWTLKFWGKSVFGNLYVYPKLSVDHIFMRAVPLCRETPKKTPETPPRPPSLFHYVLTVCCCAAVRWQNLAVRVKSLASQVLWKVTIVIRRRSGVMAQQSKCLLCKHWPELSP